MRKKKSILLPLILFIIALSPLLVFYILLPLSAIKILLLLVYLVFSYGILTLIYKINYEYFCRDCFESFHVNPFKKEEIRCKRCKGINVIKEVFVSKEELCDFNED